MGYAWPLDEVFATYDHLVRTWDGRDGRIRTVLAPDWTPACSDELYRPCRRLADEYATGITSHVLETRAEMHFSLDRYGMPALERLQTAGRARPRHGLRALRVGGRRRAADLRRQWGGRLEQPRLEPSPLGRHREGP